MEKTYRILRDTGRMTFDEMKDTFDGYWVYVVNVDFSETDDIISAIPVILGKTPYDGVHDGIYEQFRADGYAPRADTTFLPNDGFISALSFGGRIKGGDTT